MYKTDEQMIEKALATAQEDGASIFLICGSAGRRDYLFKMLENQESNCEKRVQAREFVFSNEARIKFLAVVPDNELHNWGGFQWSHVFVMDAVTPTLRDVLRMKIRSSQVFKEPKGIYHTNGAVERWETF
jgi:hypothetical protein